MNLLKTIALLGFLTGLLVLIGYLLIGGTIGAIIGLAIAALFNFAAWFYSDQAVLAFYDAKPPNRDQAELLEPMIKVLCQRAKLPTPKVYVVYTSSANAFATGRDPKHAAVAVTTGLINLLDDDEIEAVVAHELSHIKNWDTLTQTVAATIAGAVTMLAEIATNGLWFLGGSRHTRGNALSPVGSLLMLLMAPLTASMIQMSISRTREFAADAGAGSLTGNPQALANALEKLENNSRHKPMQGNPAFAPLLIINSFTSNFMTRLFSTHPPTIARVQQLQNMQSGLRSTTTKKKSKSRRYVTSAAIILAALGLTYAPIPGLQQTVVIVSGTELQEPLQQLEAKFEQANPNIKLELKFQGSQDIVNKFVDQKNDFKPTILIPASGEILTELSDRLQATNNNNPFYDSPRPIAKTILVGIAWPERGKALFPDGRFQWSKVEQAMQASSWEKIGGSSNWGSFDFVITDPTRSNSGQATLNLWAQSKLGGTLNSNSFNNSSIQSLFSLVKKSVYQPPRSTDILLQEFIARGPNDADIATVYESVALYRWQQSAANQGKPYQIYYLNPSIESTATAAIVRQNVDGVTANAARKFLDFVTQPEQQAVLVEYGFRPVNNAVDLKAVSKSPWNQNIPGAEVKPNIQTLPPPNPATLKEIQRQWERVN